MPKNNEHSDSFSVSNRVNQGSVISSLLFSIYIDNFFSKLKHWGLSCHVGLTYASAFGYAVMYSFSVILAHDYQITFNLAKSKLLCFNVSSSEVSLIYLNGTPVTVVNKDKHFGIINLSTDIYYYYYHIAIISNVCDSYRKSSSVITDFSICYSEPLDKIHSTFCMHMCGWELWCAEILYCLAQSKASHMKVTKHYS